MPSRREQIEMSPEEVSAFILTRKTMILTSLGKDGFPHPMPMWFDVDVAGHVYFATYAKSQKVKNIQRDDKVSLLCETGTEYAQLKAVYIKATAEIIQDVELAIDVLARAGMGDEVKKLDPAAAKTVRDAIRPRAEKRVVIKCTPVKTISWDHAKLGGVY